MNFPKKSSFSLSGNLGPKKSSFSLPSAKSFSRGISFGGSRGSSIGRAADEVLENTEGRRLVHVETLKSSFKVVDNLGSCYLSAKLVLADGTDIKDEKVRGETGGTGNSPEITATLGHRYRLVPGGLPRVFIQLKRKNLASHTTVGSCEVDLDEVYDQVEANRDKARAAADAADVAALAVAAASEALGVATESSNAATLEAATAAAAATTATSSLPAGGATASDGKALLSDSAAANGGNAVGGMDGSGGGAAAVGLESGLAPSEPGPSPLDGAVAAAVELAEKQMLLEAAEADSSEATEVALSAALSEHEPVQRKVYLSAAVKDGGGRGGGLGSSQPVGQVTLSFYFTGDEEEGRGSLAKRRVSIIGEEEELEDGLGDDRNPLLGGNDQAEKTPNSPHDLPSGCPSLEARLVTKKTPDGDFGDAKWLPNELEVVVVKGQGLRAMDSKTLLNRHPKSDPYVKVSVAKKHAKTPVIKKTLDPNWHCRLTLPAPDVSKLVTFRVYDEDFGGMTSDFMGRADLPLKKFLDKAPVRLRVELKNEEGSLEAVPFGHLDVVLKWRFNPDLPMNLELLEAGGHGELDDDSESGDEGVPDNDETEAGKEKAAKDLASALDEATDSVKVDSGDYMVYVHVMECRELKAKDLNGTSDPVVYVECFGHKVNTAIVGKTLNPVFDDSFTLSVRNLASEEFTDGVVKLSVFDADSLTRNDLIGSYAFDAMYVYQQPHHELWQQWVGLINETDPLNDGVQGYLKMSVSIVGPKDRLHVHKDNEDGGGAGGGAKADGKDLGSLVLMPPTIKVTMKWLVVTVHFADYLPKMDSAGVLSGTGGIDAFYQVEYGDRKPVKTSVVKAKGGSRELMCPVFNTELWVPVTFPAMTSKIKHSVWDYDYGPDPNDLVTEFTTDIKFLQSYLRRGHRKLGPDWVNLYGASVCKDPNAIANALSSLLGRSDSSEWQDKYNTSPELASTYRGRVLVSQSLRDDVPDPTKGGPKGFRNGPMPWKRKCARLKMAQEPAEEKFVLRVALANGVELPRQFKKLLVTVSCGKYELRSEVQTNLNGCAEWLFKSELEVELPTNPAFQPDVFLHLHKLESGGTATTPFCFARFKASDLLHKVRGEPGCGECGDSDEDGDGTDGSDEEGAEGKQLRAAKAAEKKKKKKKKKGSKKKKGGKEDGKGAGAQQPKHAFWPEFRWVTLQEDKSLDSLPGKMFPGALLLRLGLTTKTGSEASSSLWKALDLSCLRRTSPFVVRAHVYLGSDLPASDDNGLLDPYLKIGVKDCQRQDSKKHRETRDPLFLQTFDFATTLCDDLSLAPPLALHLFDDDWGPDPDDFCGIAFVPLQDAFVQLDPLRCLDQAKVESMNLPKTMTVIPAHDDPLQEEDSQDLLDLADHQTADTPIAAATAAKNPPGAFQGQQPKWYPFMFEKAGDGEGAVLVSLQLIPCGPDFGADPLAVPPVPDIAPATRKAFLEIVAVGLRNMLPYKLMPMQNVHLQFSMDCPSGPVSNCTSDSKKPSASDPNFLERIVVPVELPVNPIFCPALRIAAFDTRLGGHSTPNVGNCRVGLRAKCPWSPDYIPPKKLKRIEALPPPLDLEGETEEGEEGEEEGKDGDEGGDGDGGAEEKDGGVGTEAELAGNHVAGNEDGADDERESRQKNFSALDPPSLDSSPDRDLLLKNASADGADSLGGAAPAPAGSATSASQNKIKNEKRSSKASAAASASTADGKEDDDGWDGGKEVVFWNENFSEGVTAAPRDTEFEDALKAAVKTGGDDDDGTGVFGDLPRLDKKWRQVQHEIHLRELRKTSVFGKSSNWASLMDEETEKDIAEAESALRERKYLIDREALEGMTCEERLVEQGESSGEGYSAPFERYVLTRGQAGNNATFAAKDKDRSVGFFKGLIRVVEFDPTVPLKERQARESVVQAEQAAKADKAAKARREEEEEVEEEEDQGQGDKVDGDNLVGAGAVGAAVGAATSSAVAPALALDDFEVAVAQAAEDAMLATAASTLTEGESGVGATAALGATSTAVSTLPEAVVEPEQEGDLYDFEMLLGAPKTYKVRLYVMRGLGLAAMDEGWGGRPGKSDPYLRCRIGKKVVDLRDKFIQDSVDPDFFECVEMDCELPGAPLVVEVMDADDWSADDLIGATVVDLEDRWFDQTWQDLGDHTLCSVPGKVRWKAKPVELRPLRTPAQQQPQGHLECWLDILEPQQASAFPADHISLPPALKFEVRVIVWKARDVVSMDSLTNMNDTYVKVDLHGVAQQSTDIHWRAKKGKASWNYRLKFEVELGLKTPAYKYPYLKLSMWDKDIVKYDDLIAETSLDLGYYFKKVLRYASDDAHKHHTIKVFEDPPKEFTHKHKNGSGGSGLFGHSKEDDGLGIVDLNDFPPIPNENSRQFRSLFEPVAKSLQEVATLADDVLASGDQEVLASRHDQGTSLSSMLRTDQLAGTDQEATSSSSGSTGSPSSALAAAATSPLQVRDASSQVGGVELTPMVMDRSEEKKRGSELKASKQQVPVRGSDLDDQPHTSTSSSSSWCCPETSGPSFVAGVRQRKLKKRNSLDGDDQGGGNGDEDGPEEDLVDRAARLADEEEDARLLAEDEKPKRRRRKQTEEKKPGSALGCFCCLRCLCRGCCAVMTCSCFAPSPDDGGGGDQGQGDQESGGGGGGGGGKKRSGGGGGEGGEPGGEPSCCLRLCPGCFGEGEKCGEQCPCCARLLKCWCALLGLASKLVCLVLRLLLAALCCVGKCLLTFVCETLVALCPCLECCAFCLKKEEDEDEWEDIPDGEDGDDDEADLEEEAEEAKKLSNQLASLVGRGPDPPDSGWLNMDRQHPKKGAGQREPMGKLCVSIEVFPQQAAAMALAGSGRRAPNKNPNCPPPTGRLKWSWNPFVMGAQLCGPKICCYIVCFLLVGVFIVLCIYCQPFANIMLWVLVSIFVPGRR